MNHNGAALLAVLLSVTVWAVNVGSLPARPGPINGFEAFLDAQTLIYAGTGPSGRAEALLERAIQSFALEQDERLAAYWLARAHLLKALYENRRGDSRAAQAEARAAFEQIETALRDGEFSDGLRVYADAHFQMAQARGFVYMIRNGDAAAEATVRALELGPDNVLAHITGAGYFLNAPGFAGGDVDRGRELLLRALTLEPESDNDTFLVHAWLAVAWARTDRPDRSLYHWNRAVAIYPRSELLGRIGEELGFTVNR